MPRSTPSPSGSARKASNRASERACEPTHLPEARRGRGLAPPSSRPGRGQGRGGGRRLRRRHLRALAEEAQSGARGHAGRAEQRLHACPFSNEVIAGQRDLLQQQFGYDGVVRAGVVFANSAATAVDPAPRPSPSPTAAKLSYDRLVMAPGIDLDLERAARLRRGRGREDAACLEGRRADRAAAPAARGDGRRRAGGDRGSRHALSLPARPLRAGQPDRATISRRASRSRRC